MGVKGIVKVDAQILYPETPSLFEKRGLSVSNIEGAFGLSAEQAPTLNFYELDTFETKSQENAVYLLEAMLIILSRSPVILSQE